MAIPGCGSATGTSAQPIEFKPLETAKEEALRDRIDAVLDYTRTRYMTVQTNAAWQVMHGALVFGNDLMVVDLDGKLVRAVPYLLQGGEMTGWNLRPGDKGVIAILESGSKTGQGHKDQWLGYLSLSPAAIAPETPLVVNGKTYRYGDLITQSQWECRQGMEASWTLMGLSAYLPLDAKWQAQDGSEWSFDRLLKMEIEQDIAQSACGGTHRLTGITVVVNRYQKDFGKLDGVWKEAEAKVQEFVRKSREYQQQNGGFSTSYFIRPAASLDVKEQIGTTGHTLEFLMYALTDEQIREPWVTVAVDFLVDKFEKTKKLDLECGALYHAAAGLQLYRTRRFGERKLDVESEVQAAQSESTSTPAETAAPVGTSAPATTQVEPPTGEGEQPASDESPKTSVITAAKPE